MATAALTRTRLTGRLSKRLYTIRKEAGLTQEQLGELVGICLKSVNNYENKLYTGARKPIVVRRWAEVCGRSFEEVWPQRDVEIRRRACNTKTLPPRARKAGPVPVAA